MRSVVPAGTQCIVICYPALKRWAIVTATLITPIDHNSCSFACHAVLLAKTFAVLPRLRDEGGWLLA